MATFLIIVDGQNDFMPHGALGVPHGDEIIAPTNHAIQIAKEKGMKIIKTRDWHPAITEHFKKWPVHCVQNTDGAAFHPDIVSDEHDIVISKGMSTTDDGYSAFEGETANGETLDAIIKPGDKIFVAGLATDYCVLNTVVDATKRSIKTYVLSDACRGIGK